VSLSHQNKEIFHTNLRVSEIEGFVSLIERLYSTINALTV